MPSLDGGNVDTRKILMKLKWLDTFRRTEGISSAGVMWVQKSTELIILIRHNLCLAAAEC